MTDKVSMKPSDCADDGWARSVLNTTSKREVNKLKDFSLDEITEMYVAPSNDDAYFDFRSPPMMWFEAAKNYSKPHLFLKTFSLISTDAVLRKYYKLRLDISKTGGDPRYPSVLAEVVALYLNSRPKFSITKMTSFKDRLRWNAWDKSILRGFRGHASDDYGITATTLWIVYSAKAMLTSEQGSRYAADLSKMVVEEWDDWLTCEAAKMGEFERFLRSFTHVYTGDTV